MIVTIEIHVWLFVPAVRTTKKAVFDGPRATKCDGGVTELNSMVDLGACAILVNKRNDGKKCFGFKEMVKPPLLRQLKNLNNSTDPP